jgi:hypothetical protein
MGNDKMKRNDARRENKRYHERYVMMMHTEQASTHFRGYLV